MAKFTYTVYPIYFSGEDGNFTIEFWHHLKAQYLIGTNIFQICSVWSKFQKAYLRSHQYRYTLVY